MANPCAMPAAWKKYLFTLQVTVALIVGLGLGILAKATGAAWLNGAMTFGGDIFVQLLKLAVIPLIFTMIVASITSLSTGRVGTKTAARLGGKTLFWFGITSVIAVVIGIAVALVIRPGEGVKLPSDSAQTSTEAGKWTDFVKEIVPSNPVSAFAEGNVPQIVFLAIVFALAASAIGKKAQPFIELNAAILEIAQRALLWLIRIIPIGAVFLIGSAASSHGIDLVGPLIKFTASIYIGCLVILIGVYPLVLWIFGRVSPLSFFVRSWQAIQFGFVSCSSIAALPISKKAATEKLGIQRDYADFAVPFGAAVKMDGGAGVYPAVAAIFVAQISGHPLDLVDYGIIVLISLCASASSSGQTSGALAILTLTLAAVGLPLTSVGLLLAIDPILDMMRTATNVAGQLAIPVVVAHSERILDRTAWKGRKNPLGSLRPRLELSPSRRTA